MDEIDVDSIGTKHICMLAERLTKVLPISALSEIRDKLHIVDVGLSIDPCGAFHDQEPVHVCMASVSVVH